MSQDKTEIQYYDDEPLENSKLFGNDTISSTIKDIILDKDLHTPFAICIDGEWGEGKTSLLRSVYNKVNSEVRNNGLNENQKVLWFNAWEYERLDPVAALLFRIQELYKGKKDKFRKTAKNLGLVLFDMAIRAHTNMSLPEMRGYFQDSVKSITSIKEDLENLVEQGKLIIFIDDLNRCLIDKTLEMLEALKIFLNARNVIVVSAADIHKLERAWELRYNKLSSIDEGRDHIDKIFQLKISLPFKYETDMKKYFEQLKSSYSAEEEKLISIGCRNNPRKIKKVFNLLNFSKRFKTFESHDEKTSIILWYTLSAVYHQFFKLVKGSQSSLVTTLIIIYQIGSFEDAKNKIDSFMYMEAGEKNHLISLNENFRVPKDHIFHKKRDVAYPNKNL